MSLAARLFLLTLLAALPIFGILVVQEAQLRSDERDQIMAMASRAADLAVARQVRTLNSARTLLELASRIPAVRTREPGECRRELARLVASIPGTEGISSISPGGETFCTDELDTGPVEVPISDRAYLQDAVKTGQFVASGFIVGRVSGVGSIVYSFPVLNADGDVETVLVLPVQIHTLAPTLNDPPLPPGAFAALVDRAGIVALRWPDPDAWAGKEARAMSWGDAMARRAPTFTENGIEYAFASRTVDGINDDNTLVLGVPITPEIALIRDRFIRSFALMVGAFLLAAVGALLIARVWVERPINALQTAAEAMAAGNLKVRPPLASIPAVRALSDKFVAMAEALELRLNQKDILLQEVNHRVKNSLQLVSSVLMLHRAGVSDEKVRQQFDEVAAKIATVARVHQRLYRDDDVASLDFGAFLEEMCKDLESALGGYNLANIHCSAEPCRLATDTAIPLSLIINELVTNAAKYGCGPSGEGDVHVNLKKDGGSIVVSVTDSGPLPAGFAIRQSSGLGMRLIAGLLDQLRGTVDVVPQGSGKSFVVRVPV